MSTPDTKPIGACTGAELEAEKVRRSIFRADVEIWRLYLIVEGMRSRNGRRRAALAALEHRIAGGAA